MNQYKEQWMEHATALIPKTIKINQASQQVEMTWDLNPELGIAAQKTARAIATGATLAAMDGPLPIMDVVGFGVATGMAIHAWYEYFS